MIEIFYKWSGLKVKRGKTQLTIFGRKYSKPSFVDRLRIKWFSTFKLFGIQFCNTLTDMHNDYQKGIQNMRDVANNWKFCYLTLFGKITVIKTYMLPQLTHIATVVQNLATKQIEEIHKVWEEFINPIRGGV